MMIHLGLLAALVHTAFSQTCDHGGKTYHQPEQYVADCERCTCFSGKWDCEFFNTGNCKQPAAMDLKKPAVQEPEVTCVRGQKQYGNGERVIDDCERCTCFSGKWDCEFFNTGNCKQPATMNKQYKKPAVQEPEVTCVRGQKQYGNGERVIDDCERCTCFSGKWDCEFFNTGNCKQPAAMDLKKPAVQEPEVTCVRGQKQYGNGERVIGDCERCTCFSGKWDCEFFNTGNCKQPATMNKQYKKPVVQEPEVTCVRGQKQYGNGERVIGDCERCTCFSGKWDCEFYNTGNCKQVIGKMIRSMKAGVKPAQVKGVAVAERSSGAADDETTGEKAAAGKPTKAVFFVVGAVALVAAFGGIALAVTVFKAPAAERQDLVAYEEVTEPMVEQDVEAASSSCMTQQVS